MMTSTGIMIAGGVFGAVSGVLVCMPGSAGRRLVDTKLFLRPVEVVPLLFGLMAICFAGAATERFVPPGATYLLISDLILGSIGVLLLWMFVLSLIGGHRRHKQEARDPSETADSAKDPWLFS
jgi:hypothetical protein